ncbi:hypothetical protein QE412_001161 [Microbacterium trichothecenolyticum]|uniref:Cohesin domain-containing protein n=1 Tax=Microbacterium trichothecenolyticum TaxID=69370 RepID=A0ABU0TSE1_MICTR|nr:hypothetical protein [Microbacterium trichothecenolyticum]
MPRAIRSSPTGERFSRTRARLLLFVAIGVVAFVPVSATAVVTASTPNARTAVAAELSATSGEVGDPIALDLDVVGGDDLYAATIRLRYDAAKVAVDPDRVVSDFPGMFSLSGAQGTLDFSVTRLGTSSGKAGELSLGSIGFVATGAGESRIRVEQVTIIDSGLGRTTSSPAIDLTYTASLASQPSAAPSSPTGGSTDDTGSAGAPPVSVTGYGSGVSRAGDAVVDSGPAPQSSAAPTHTAVKIAASSPSPRVGEKITVTVSGLPVNTAHRVELHSDPLLLGEPVTDDVGSFVLDTTIPATAPLGEHEIVVVRGGIPVASLPVRIMPAQASTPAPTATAPSATDDDTGGTGGATETTAASASSSSSWVWGVGALLAVTALLAAGAMTARARRARRSARDDGNPA